MKAAIKKLISSGVKSPQPGNVSPMLCTLTNQLPVGDNFTYEIKWDGYRIIGQKKGGQVILSSRSGLNYTSRYPPIVEALKKLRHDVVLDGEAVVFNEHGIPDFDSLQLYNGHDTPVSYCIFDILWIDGVDLRELPLVQRKTILKEVIGKSEVLRFSESFDDGPGLYQQALNLGLEGIVAKKRDSAYHEGERANNWFKIPARKRQEFVIGGWAESDKNRSFRSLLFGAYNNGNFEWIGRSGGGYKEKEMLGILKKLKALEIKLSPFVNKVLDTKGATLHWVKPKLVANFEFATWTKSGRIRKPATFLGFRNDKKASEVVREIPKEIEAVNEQQNIDIPSSSDLKVRGTKQIGKYLNSGSNWKSVDEEQKGAIWTDFKMENCTIPVHNLDRELWTGITKGDLLLYYSQMSKWILPYVQYRPQSLVLKLTHAGGPKLFIKDMENRHPECASVFSDRRRVLKEGKRAKIDYLICNNVETLIYMVDTGCVDINCWASHLPDVEYPDYIWLDLDPTVANNLKGAKLIERENEGFQKAMEIAIAAKKILDKLKLTGFLKTSGQTGLHIYIPCSRFTFGQTRTLAYKIADDVHKVTPKISTRRESKDLRGDQVYIDAGQNDYADTLAAPYCIRPYHAPLVSTPLEWSELTKKLDRYAFQIHNIGLRLKVKGDLFKGTIDRKIRDDNTKRLNEML
jgi:bifunctional non-homologous end joining protein LigD